MFLPGRRSLLSLMGMKAVVFIGLLVKFAVEILNRKIHIIHYEAERYKYDRFILQELAHCFDLFRDVHVSRISCTYR